MRAVISAVVLLVSQVVSHGGAKEATLFAIGSSTKSFTTMAGVISQDQVELARRFTGYSHKP